MPYKATKSTASSLVMEGLVAIIRDNHLTHNYTLDYTMASSCWAGAATNPFTITRYILQEQKKYPHAKGDLTIILNSVTLAIKIISAAAAGAGIFQRYGVKRLKEEPITTLPNYSPQKGDELKDNDDDDAAVTPSRTMRPRSRAFASSRTTRSSRRSRGAARSP